MIDYLYYCRACTLQYKGNCWRDLMIKKMIKKMIKNDNDKKKKNLI